jgi:hypothetical protein
VHCPAFSYHEEHEGHEGSSFASTFVFFVLFVVELSFFNVTAERKLIAIRIVNDEIPHPIRLVSRFAGWFCAGRCNLAEVIVDLVAKNVRVAASARAVIAGLSPPGWS